jgi:hypothetical protein
MGKNFHYSILPFYKDKIFSKCDKITSIKDLSNKDYYIFQINRKNSYSSFRIFLSDAYLFTENDYYEIFNLLKKGDFILIARPESNYNENLLEKISYDGFYIGKSNFLVKFLNNDRLYIDESIKKEIREIKKKKNAG